MSILIINPCSNGAITDRLKDETDPAPDFTYKFFTAPCGSQNEYQSITSEVLSVQPCLEALVPVLDHHDAFLVAAYSDHPLIRVLREHTDKPVLGTLQASILQALAFGAGAFAIVTTVKSRRKQIEAAVSAMLGQNPAYSGTFSTKYDAHELMELPQNTAADEMALTTSRALETGAKYILLGFVGQPNLEETVRRAAGRNAMVIDGAKAGAEVLVGLVRSQT